MPQKHPPAKYISFITINFKYWTKIVQAEYNGKTKTLFCLAIVLLSVAVDVLQACGLHGGSALRSVPLLCAAILLKLSWLFRVLNVTLHELLRGR